MQVTREAVRGVQRLGLLSWVGLLVAVSMFASAASSCGAYVAQRRASTAVHAVDRESAERQHDACLDLNRNRADARSLTLAGDLAAGEALIESFSTTSTTPQTAAAIERYRKNLARRERALIAQHAEEDLDCDRVAPLP